MLDPLSQKEHLKEEKGKVIKIVKEIKLNSETFEIETNLITRDIREQLKQLSYLNEEDNIVIKDYFIHQLREIADIEIDGLEEELKANIKGEDKMKRKEQLRKSNLHKIQSRLHQAYELIEEHKEQFKDSKEIRILENTQNNLGIEIELIDSVLRVIDNTKNTLKSPTKPKG